MACCIAIALVIGAVRTAWFKVFPSRAPVQLAFAPPTRRPAPGAEARTLPEVPAARAPRPVRSRGTALIVGGVAWLAASELAAHVLHLIPHSDVLHTPGPIAVAVGLALRGGLRLPRLLPRPLPTR